MLGAFALPEPSLPGGDGCLAFVGALLRDRAKGDGGVALTSSWWLFHFGGRVSR